MVYLWSYNEKMNERFENAIHTYRLHWFHGQYSWSIRIGLLTLTIIMSKKCILVAVLLAAEAGHVLILTPLVVLINVQFFTMTPSTSSSLVYLPRLPMLIPCPGLHVTLVTSISLLPSPREMQSSPVAILDFVIVILFDGPMCIPSEFGLFSGAIILILWNVRLLQLRTLIWKFLLSSDVILLTVELVMKLNLKL